MFQIRIALALILGLTALASHAAAWYSPDQGRFVQRDPLGYIDGMNLYRLGRNNPMLYMDPYGLQACDSHITFTDCTQELKDCIEGSEEARAAYALFVSQCFAGEEGTPDKLDGPIEVICDENHSAFQVDESHPLDKTRRKPPGGQFKCTENRIYLKKSGGSSDNCATLAHELIHAADHCQTGVCVGDDNYCQQLICSEARAHGYSTCRWEGSKSSFRMCMRRARSAYISAALAEGKSCAHIADEAIVGGYWDDCAPPYEEVKRHPENPLEIPPGDHLP